MVLEHLLLIVQLLTSILVGLIAWIGRKYIKKIELNTRHRRHLQGDDRFNGEGRIDHIDDVHHDLQRDHEETQKFLRRMADRLDAVIEAINESDLEVEVDKEATTDDDSFPITDD